MDQNHTLPKGTVLDDGTFEIGDMLGKGGFAYTYRARDSKLQRDVAVKEYFPHQSAVREGANVRVRSSNDEAAFRYGLNRFKNEAQTLARFKHPNIVRVYRVFEAHETAYIVLEFVPGPSLEVWLTQLGRPLNQAECDDLAKPLLEALRTVHEQKVWHRDIKPQNIIMRPAEPKPVPILLDFGSARLATSDSKATKTFALVSEGYSPFEAYSADGTKQSAATDIYMMAATLYRGITKAPPPAAMERKLEESLVPATKSIKKNQALRPEFLKAIDWALAVDAVNRPQSIEEWQARLLPEPATGPAPRSRAGDAAPGDPGPASGAAKNETFTRVKTTKTKAATAPSPATAATTKAQTEAVAAPKTGFPLFALGGFLLIAGGIGATVTVLNNPGWLDGGSGGGGLAAAGKVAKPEGPKQAAAGSVGAPSTAPAPASKPATAEPVPPEAPKQAQSSPPPPPQPTAEGTKTEPPKQPQQVAIVTPQTAPVVPPPVSERWRTLGEGSLKIASSAISSDRTTIATGDQSGGVTVWNAETGRKIEGATIAAPSGNTAGHLAFASGPKGVLAFTSPRDSGPSFWTPGQTEPVPPAKSESGRWNVALVHSKAANAFVLVLVKAVPGAEGYQTVIERWTGKSDTPSGQDKADVDGLVNAAAISPGGDFLALASTNRKIAIWNIAAKEKTGSDIASDLDVRALAISNQGLRLAAGGQNPESGQQNRIVLFGIKDPKAQKAIDIDGATVVGLAFSPDDRFLASGEIDGGAGRVSIWDLETRKLVGRRIEGATADPAILRSLSFSGGAAGAPLSVLVPWADGSLHNEPVCIASDSDCVAKISAAESRGKG